MKRSQLTAGLVGLAVIAALSSTAHARLHVMMHGSNVYPSVATPMPALPAAPLVPMASRPMRAIAARPMAARMPAPTAPDLDKPHVGPTLYPDAAGALLTIHRDPMDPPALFAPTGEHPDGPNLYQYVRSNPVRWQDPQGTNIYLKRGNNTGNPVNDAVHESVCVDTLFSNGKKGQDLACFSFGLYGAGWVLPGRWLGWWLPPKPQFGFVMAGKIYEAPNVGTVIKQKETTCEQDQKWLLWMVDNRLDTKDVYSPLVHNCVTYSRKEYDDAPGNH